MHHRRRFRNVAVYAFLALVVGAAMGQQPEQKISKHERDEVLHMLTTISVDPKLHGIDWEANVKTYSQKIETVPSLNRGLSEIAGALDVLDDSHTFFLPPRPYIHSYGWRIATIGDKCFVLGVRPQTDAEKKGIKEGNQVLTINGFTPTPDNLWKMNYTLDVLRPQPALRVSLLSSTNDRKDLDVVASMHQVPPVRDLTGEGIWDYLREIEEQSHENGMRWVGTKDGVMILKFPEFVYQDTQVDDVMKTARKYQALVIDLRGNPGGSVDTLRTFLGSFFDHEVKIADRVTRDSSKPVLTRSIGRNAFTGKLMILVDSASASASEVLVRVVQLEKRGTVLGDRSAGAVMESKRYQYLLSFHHRRRPAHDGKSLERVGVTPDEVIQPTAADLTAGRDPVLARAVEIVGGRMSPERAGALFPYEWPKQ